ncbi:MAG: WD40 repeat domain-containing protein, partial [Chlorobi bacterium]|nr:WD40 repeat domain-containing protein [Chlorobiota bacterium]
MQLLRNLVGWSVILLFLAWPRPVAGQEQKLSLYLEEGKSGTVWDIVFSRDEAKIISCGRDSTVKVWNALTGAAERTFRARKPTLMTCLALSPGGNIVAAGDMNGVVTLWEWKTGLMIQAIKASNVYLTDIAFARDGRLVTASRDDSVRVWTARDFRLEKSWSAAMIWINRIALSPDSRTIAAAGADGSVTLWNLDGSNARTIVKHGRAASAVAFSPDGSFLFSGARDGSISVYELSRRREKTLFALDRGFASDFAWTSNPGEVLVAAQGEVVTVYDWQRGSRVRGLTPSSQGAMRVIVSGDKKRIYTAQIDGGVHVFDYSTGLELATMVGFSDGQWICFTPDGFFESSQFGSRYAQWKQGQEFFPFDLYEKIFHKPGIVEDALQGKYTAREALTSVV